MSDAVPAGWTAMPESGEDGWPGVRALESRPPRSLACVEAGGGRWRPVEAEQAGDRLEAPIRGFSTHMSTAHRPARHRGMARLTNGTRPLNSCEAEDPARSRPEVVKARSARRPRPGVLRGKGRCLILGPPVLGSRRPAPVGSLACRSGHHLDRRRTDRRMAVVADCLRTCTRARARASARMPAG
jgi:hypothetical protein